MDTHVQSDQTKSEEFADKVLQDTKGLAVTIMAALADALGLFKSLASDGPATTAELAGRAGIDERYALEWLAGMRSAGYLAYEPQSGRFSLPPEHIPVLAEEGGALFIGGTHQLLLGMIEVVPLLKRAFSEGGGVPMSAYGEQTWVGMERDMVGIYNSRLLPIWIPAMPDVQVMLHRGVSVADVGCGAGKVLILLAEAFPNSRYVGYDIYEPNVARATWRAEEASVSGRVRFEVANAVEGLPAQHDIITTFDVIHDATDPLGLLRSIRTALRPGGRYIALEPRSEERLEDNNGTYTTLRYGFSLLYCMTTSLASGGLGLGALGMPESKMRTLCKEAGFGDVRLVPLEDSFHNLFEITP